MNKEEWLKALQAYCEKNNSFELNPDAEHVGKIIDGVLTNEEKYGLKLCPCRVRDGSREKDLELLCPCNFFTHKTWEEKGQCWCGLIVKTKV
jgi:ferredoxin-thioredoxin reductase catalytic subunit